MNFQNSKRRAHLKAKTLYRNMQLKAPGPTFQLGSMASSLNLHNDVYKIELSDPRFGVDSESTEGYN